MIEQIKTKFYQILSDTLAYNVTDGEHDINTFPCVILRMGNITRDRSHNVFLYQVKMKVDIFSNYDGEKEILDMEAAIFDELDTLYDLENVTYVKENSFRIIDDKSTAVVRKHGIGTYTIYLTGGLEEQEEDEEDEDEPSTP